MAEFNYSKYVATMAQRKGPMHEEAEANPASDVFLNQSQSTDNYVNESETIYEFGSDGNCYRIDDEGNRDMVSDSYCQRYGGQGVRETHAEPDADNEGGPSDHDADNKMKESDLEEVDNYRQSVTDKIKIDIEQDLTYFSNSRDQIEYLKGLIDFSNMKMQELRNEEEDQDVLGSMGDGLGEAIDDTDTEPTDDEFGSTDSDKEPTKKDIKAAEKEFNLTIPKADDSVADSALEKAKQIIKIKVGKILSQPKGQRSKSTDLVALKQFIQRVDIKKAFKARGLDVMDFVKDVIA
jgi:hypothetical protein